MYYVNISIKTIIKNRCTIVFDRFSYNDIILAQGNLEKVLVNIRYVSKMILCNYNLNIVLKGLTNSYNLNSYQMWNLPTNIRTEM